jgi:hypothetical protein
VRPYSPELEQAMADMEAMELEIEKELSMPGAAALDYLQDYFRVTSSAFRNVDSNLKQFCLRLSAVGQPLKTILHML